MGTKSISTSLTGMTKDEQALRARLALLSESEKIDLIIELMSRIEQLPDRMAKLEARVGMNSKNSSKRRPAMGTPSRIRRVFVKAAGVSPADRKGIRERRFVRLRNRMRLWCMSPNGALAGAGWKTPRSNRWKVARFSIFPRNWYG